MFSWRRLNTPGMLARGGPGGVIKRFRATGPPPVETETQRPYPILLGAQTRLHIMDSDRITCATRMPMRRAAYFANGHDVRDVVVAGEILMRDRVVPHVDETALREEAEAATAAMLAQAGLAAMVAEDRGWGGRAAAEAH